MGKKMILETGSFMCVFYCQPFVCSFSNYMQRSKRFLPAFRKYLHKCSSKCAVEATLNIEFHSQIPHLTSFLIINELKFIKCSWAVSEEQCPEQLPSQR